jgi:hypothetical protein
MKKSTAKALYLYLCSILGMIMLAMLHRAVFVLYDLLLMMDYETYSFGMTERTVLTMDFTTMLVALFLGGWYGIALGLEWYSMVYGPNADEKVGWFHGFKPHHWRGSKSERKSVTLKDSSPVHNRDWSFDDLINAEPDKKRTAGRKTARKTVARKTTSRVKASETE